MKDIYLQGVGLTSQRARERLVCTLRQMGIDQPAILETIVRIPRHCFVDDAISHRAYDNVALPIASQQTISQPYIVAYMTQLLLARKQAPRVLEIGTGSGYQAAILAQFYDEVYSVERIRKLWKDAQKKLYTLGLHNIHLRHDDGHHGWLDAAPFDAVIVTAMTQKVPPKLIQQVIDGGQIVIPVQEGTQQNIHQLICRQGAIIQRNVLEAVSFVPLLAGKQID